MFYYYLCNVIYPTIAAFVSVAVGVLAWQHRKVVGAKALAGIGAIGFLTEAAFIFEHISKTLPMKIVWDNFGYLSQDILAITYLIFALQYTGYVQRCSYRMILILLIEPIIDAIFLLTPLGTGLVRNQVSLNETGIFPMLVAKNGVWDLIDTAYLLAMILVAILVIAIRCIHSRNVFRRQCYIIIFGCLLPFIGGMLYFFEFLKTEQFYIAYVLFGLGNMIVTWGLLKEDLLGFLQVNPNTILDGLPQGILVLDNSDRITEINAAGEKALGIQANAVIGKTFENILKLVQARFTRESNSNICSEFTIERNGAAKKYATSKTFLHDDVGNKLGVIVAFNDVTEISRQLEEVKKDSAVDRLTGALIRHFFEDISRNELMKQAAKERPISLILFDVDYFKLINDTYGHVVGDVVLRDIGTIVLNNINKKTLFGRWGGEEFVILLQAPLDEAVLLAEKLRFLIQKHQFHSVPSVSASFGIAQNKRSDTIETLISRADMAMYSAKRTGKNRIEIA